MTVHAQLRKAYRESGKSLRVIVAESGVSESTVLNALNGRNVTIANLVAVASVVGVRVLHIQTERP